MGKWENSKSSQEQWIAISFGISQRISTILWFRLHTISISEWMQLQGIRKAWSADK